MAKPHQRACKEKGHVLAGVNPGKLFIPKLTLNCVHHDLHSRKFRLMAGRGKSCSSCNIREKRPISPTGLLLPALGETTPGVLPELTLVARRGKVSSGRRKTYEPGRPAFSSHNLPRRGVPIQKCSQAVDLFGQHLFSQLTQPVPFPGSSTALLAIFLTRSIKPC